MGLDASLYREVRLSDDTKTTGKEWEKVVRIGLGLVTTLYGGQKGQLGLETIVKATKRSIG